MARPARPYQINAGPKGRHTEQRRESKMKHLLKLTAAPAIALAAAAFMSVAAPTQASAGEYCRKDVTSAVTSCSFDTMEQCHAMSSGRGGDCFRDPFLPARDALAYAPKPLHAKHGAHRARTHAE